MRTPSDERTILAIASRTAIKAQPNAPNDQQSPPPNDELDVETARKIAKKLKAATLSRQSPRIVTVRRFSYV